MCEDGKANHTQREGSAIFEPRARAHIMLDYLDFLHF